MESGDLEKILVLIEKIEPKMSHSKDVYELLYELSSKRGQGINDISKRQYEAFKRVKNALSTLTLNINKIREDKW